MIFNYLNFYANQTTIMKRYRYLNNKDVRKMDVAYACKDIKDKYVF